MNVILFVLLGLSIAMNISLFKTAKDLKKRCLKAEKDERRNVN